MLKSLFSGVSGLQSHQIAMDVESNNIANVNTIGFKYSRANFSDLLAQTNQIATAPQGDLGGKNNVQIGLGATVASITRIHSQGSIQNTDKNTDVAIQGDGFFILSGDDGNTYKYSRSGDFKFDANGNFVDNNGFVIQGWLRDEITGNVDSTAPIASINIPPGLTTPAEATDNVTLKANLNSGSNIESSSPTYSIINNPASTLAVPLPGIVVDADGNAIQNPPAFEDVGVMFNEQGEAFNLQVGQGIWAGFTPSIANSGALAGPDPLVAVTPYSVSFTLDDGTTATASYTGQIGDTKATVLTNYISAINAISNTTGITAKLNGTTIDLENLNNDGNASHNIRIAAAPAQAGSAFGTFPLTDNLVTSFRYEYGQTGNSVQGTGPKTFNTIEDLRNALQQELQQDLDNDGTIETGAVVEVTPEGRIIIRNGTGTVDPLGAPANLTVDDRVVQIAVTKLSSATVTENVRFTEVMQSLNGTLPIGTAGTSLSQSFNAATHSSSIDIYDSLGSKHTLRMEFRKVDVDLTTGSRWDMKLSVPEPATIGTTAPFNEINGQVRFNNDGSLSTYNPINFSFTGNNGSAPDQQVRLGFGTSNAFDGMTSFDSRSATSGISQDGFTGGDLVGIRIDQSGTLIGSFSNGRAFGLAQIGMAKFANNEGMSADGGNIFLQSANSGDPIIGEAATAGRGFIQSAALEASNVDLSRSLTQLIIIQRGYQANGKTITTSDQLLNTLINLKN